RALAQQQPGDNAGESQAGKQSGGKQQHNHKDPGVVRSVQRLSAKPVLTAMQACGGVQCQWRPPRARARARYRQ
ncbi:hypothetical protein, partial [Xanthomonas arboricola]|uniref:hypothetical protein n=1 Tax=Xanthomonas arboricola TaxID=56448 RepID=UPI001E37FAA4